MKIEANEYQQMAALLVNEIDLLEEICNDKVSAADLKYFIRDLKKRKDEWINNKKAREEQFAAVALISFFTRN